MSTPDDNDVSKDPEADCKAETEGAETEDAPGGEARDIDAEPAFSPAAEEGAAALSNLGKRRGSDLFRED